MLTTAGDEENNEKCDNKQDEGKEFDHIDIALRMSTEEPFDPDAEENRPGFERQKTENLDAKWLKNYV